MKYLQTVRENRAKLAQERAALLAELDGLGADVDGEKPEERSTRLSGEAERAGVITARLTAIRGEDEQLASTEAELADAEQRAAAAAKVPTIIQRVDDTPVDVRYLRPTEARDRAMKILERDGARRLNARQVDDLDRKLRTRNDDFDGDYVARLMIVTESDAYRSAFAKALTHAQPAFNPEEARAVDEFRAMSSTSAAGGYGVPVLIDPTIILTSGAAAAPILAISRVVNITTDTWKGVSSAGVSWSFDAESTAVSDDSPTLAQPTVSVHEARGYIPYSMRIAEDYPGFADEMSSLLDQGYVDLLASKTMTGSGTNEPWGIFTALDANTNVEVVVTTDGAFGSVDVRKVWGQLPERYRARASWLFSVTTENQIRSWSTSGTGSDYTITLAEGGVPQLTGRRVVVTDYAPAFTGTTGAANIAIVGDFSNYVVAQRVGMSVELVPFVFDVTNNRPTGERGWFARARIGADSVNDLGFRLLQNQ